MHQELKNQYHLPPEWVAQKAIMLTWPHKDTIWGEMLDDIEPVFVEVVRQIVPYEKVIISARDVAHVTQKLQNGGVDLQNVSIYKVAGDDIWVRDHGPITVWANEKPHLLDFEFNGWGNKYDHDRDNAVTQSLHAQQAFGEWTKESVPMVLEGGSIEVDGRGTLLTTSSCLLAKTRNPSLSKAEIEQQLQQKLGVQRILWLDYGYLAGDDTDGHIDTLARFCDERTICYVRCTDSNDEHFAEFQAMEKQLQTFTDFEGNPYRLVPLPWPKAQRAKLDGRRLPATYANFLILNDAILVPTYRDQADKEALEIIANCFPGRKIIGIDAVPVIQWNGSIHCMTMQLIKGESI